MSSHAPLRSCRLGSCYFSLLGDPSSGQVEKHVIKRRTPDLYLLVRQGSLSDRDENVGQFSIVERDVDVSLVLELGSGYSRGEELEPVLARLSNHQCLERRARTGSSSPPLDRKSTRLN